MAGKFKCLCPFMDEENFMSNNATGMQVYVHPVDADGMAICWNELVNIIFNWYKFDLILKHAFEINKFKLNEVFKKRWFHFMFYFEFYCNRKCNL